MRLRKKKTLLDQASDYVEAVKPQFESAVATAKDTAVNKALPLLADARDKAGTTYADAREKAGPMLADARVKAGTTYADAREKAGPAIADAREKAAPIIASGAALAAEKAAAGKEFANAKVAELKGEPAPKKRGGKLKKILVFTGLAAVAGVVVKRLTADRTADNWQSSYVPTPAPATTRPTATPPVATTPVDDADDSAGSSPDEALADSTEAPHQVTTPDDPAEVVEIHDDKS